MEIVAILGQGGMGTVYKARQPELDRTVAIKILLPNLGTDPEFVERFQREAQALATLSHPNIVAIHEFGKEEELCFFVMEYVPGQNLRTLFRRKALPPEEALLLVPQICDAIHYAHRAGIVHRDIKPENILLDLAGNIRVTDFGLAKLTGDGNKALTEPGALMGTPRYMSPEQFENPSGVDYRTDIYAVGVLLYEMLTGELPLGKFDPPSGTKGIDSRLDPVVLKALEKDPEKRFQRITELRVQPGPGRKSPVSRPRRKRLLLIPAIAIALLAASVPFWGRIFPPQPAAPSDPAVREEGPLTLEDLLFDERDAPGSYVFARPAENLPRSPFLAESAGDLEITAKNLDDMGVLNLSPSQMSRAYTATFFRWNLGFFAVECPDETTARKVQRQGDAWTVRKKWIRRRGKIVLLAFLTRKEFSWEIGFRQLVNRLSEKMGEKPPFPVPGVEFMELFDRELPPGSRFASHPSFSLEGDDFPDIPGKGVKGSFRATISPSRVEVLAVDIPDRLARAEFRDAFEDSIATAARQSRHTFGTLLLFLWTPLETKPARLDFYWIRTLYERRISGDIHGDPLKEMLSRAASMDPRLFFEWRDAGTPPHTKDLSRPNLTSVLLSLSETDTDFHWTGTPDLERIWNHVGRGKNGRITLLQPGEIRSVEKNVARVEILGHLSFEIGFRIREEKVVEFELLPSGRRIVRVGNSWKLENGDD